MGRAATITVRIEEELKLKIERRAQREHRSLSAQVEHELEMALEDEKPPASSAKSGSFLGRYEGTKVPGESDFREVRGLLWGKLPR